MPSRDAISAGTRSDISRSISTCVSGSPKRTLYSISFGPSGVIISPANSTPLYGAPIALMARKVGRMISSMVRCCICAVITGAGE